MCWEGMAAGSLAQEVPNPTTIRDWDNTGRRVLHLLLCSSPGVCSWPSCTQGTELGPPWCCYCLTSLTARWALLPRALCGLTSWNIKDFLRNSGGENSTDEGKALKGFCCECAHGMSLCACDWGWMETEEQTRLATDCDGSGMTLGL